MYYFYSILVLNSFLSKCLRKIMYIYYSYFRIFLLYLLINLNFVYSFFYSFTNHSRGETLSLIQVPE